MSYINTAKRLLGEHGRLELCALGIALAPLVTVAGRHLCFHCCSGEQLYVCTAAQHSCTGLLVQLQSGHPSGWGSELSALTVIPCLQNSSRVPSWQWRRELRQHSRLSPSEPGKACSHTITCPGTFCSFRDCPLPSNSAAHIMSSGHTSMFPELPNCYEAWAAMLQQHGGSSPTCRSRHSCAVCQHRHHMMSHHLTPIPRPAGSGRRPSWWSFCARALSTMTSLLVSAWSANAQQYVPDHL